MELKNFAKFKSLRRNAVFLFTKGHSVDYIAKHCSIDDMVIWKLLINYLRNEGRYSPKYSVSPEKKRYIKDFVREKQPKDIGDAALTLLVPESTVRRIVHQSDFEITDEWIKSCAFNFYLFGYTPEDIQMPYGVDSSIKRRIVHEMDRLNSDPEGVDLMSENSNASEIADSRPAMSEDEIQERIELVKALLRAAYNYGDKKASEIVYVGKYYLQGYEIEKIARLMAMDKDLAGVRKDLDAFLVAEECLDHPEKQSCGMLKKQPDIEEEENEEMSDGNETLVVRDGSRKWMPANVNQLITDYKNGATIKQLMEKYQGVSAYTIEIIFRENDVPIRPNYTPSEKLVAAYKSGMSIREIAAEFDMVYNTAWNRLNAAGMFANDAMAGKSASKPVSKKAIKNTSASASRASAPETNKPERIPTDKFGSMDFFLDMYMLVDSTSTISALDFMRLMLNIADSKSTADKTAVTKKMISVIASSKDPAAIDTAALQSTVETYVTAASELAQM